MDDVDISSAEFFGFLLGYIRSCGQIKRMPVNGAARLDHVISTKHLVQLGIGGISLRNKEQSCTTACLVKAASRVANSNRVHRHLRLEARSRRGEAWVPVLSSPALNRLDPE